MANPLDNAKTKWKNASDYEQLPLYGSTLLGVEADGNIFVVNPNNGVSTVSAVGGVIVTKTVLGPSYKVLDSVAFMRASNPNSTNGIDAVDVSIFEGYAEADLQPLYAGAGVGFRLVGGTASIFDFNLGAGLSSGIGLKDESVQLKGAGIGFTVGRKLSISVLDNSFGVDLVRTKDAVWFVGDQLFTAVAVVPGAMKNAGADLLEQFLSMPTAFANAGADLWKSMKQIPGAFAPIPGAFADAGKQLGGMIAGGVGSVVDGVAGAGSTVVNTAGEIGGTIAGGVGSVVDGVAGVGTKAKEKAKETIEKISSWFD